MCFELDSLPPVPPISGAAVSHRDLVLEAQDGARFAAFAALPEDPAGDGVVILPDVRGLYRFYEELALRFAESGVAAVAVDYFGRSAGIGKRGEDFPFGEHVQQTRPETIQLDVAAAAAWLHSEAGGGCGALFTVGFCFGGRNAWLAAAEGHCLAGAIGFYGRPGAGADGSPGPAQRARELRAPILALMGGADDGIPQAEVAGFDAALEAAGVEHEVVSYEGAPHSFFDRRFEQFAGESADAWTRALDFIKRHGVRAAAASPR
ncbi:MAG: dienelactone hydrolase family protein [Gaiellaceae bacterium]